MYDESALNVIRGDIKELSEKIEELAKALSTLALVVNDHNMAIRVAAEEQSYIIDKLNIVRDHDMVSSFDLKKKEKPN